MAEEDQIQKTVLVVDDTKMFRIIAGQVFRKGGATVVEAENGKQALLQADLHRPDLVIMDVMMPEMTGLEALNQFRSNPKFRNLPIIMLTSEQDPKTVAIAQIEGVTDYILKTEKEEIERRLQPYLSLLLHKNGQAKRVVVVDDSAVVRHFVVNIFKKAGHLVTTATDGREALEVIRAQKPHLIILDVHMPEMTGTQVLRILRQLPEFQQMPVIMLTSEHHRETVADIISAGVDDYIVKDNMDEVSRRLKAYLAVF